MDSPVNSPSSDRKRYHVDEDSDDDCIDHEDIHTGMYKGKCVLLNYISHCVLVNVFISQKRDDCVGYIILLRINRYIDVVRCPYDVNYVQLNDKSI